MDTIKKDNKPPETKPILCKFPTLEQITEIDGDSIRLLALTREGVWVTLFELEITEEVFNFYRVPLIVKFEPLEHLPELNDQPLPEEDRVAIPQL